jgi:hypothetical protein
MLTWTLVSFLLAARLTLPATEIPSAQPGHGPFVLSHRSSERNDLNPRFRRGEVADEESEEEVLDGHEPVDFASCLAAGASSLFLLLRTDSAPHPCTTNDRCRSLRGPPGHPLLLPRGL